LARSPKKRLV